MSDFLAEMSEASFLRARTTRESADAIGLEARVASAPPVVPLALAPAGFDIIAEAKLASPTEGPLIGEETGDVAVARLVAAYAAKGAIAVSVLTEPDRFSGSLDHLERAAREVAVPVLRKDFLVDPIQIVEARAAGASGVLLIARMLSDERLTEMTDLALAHGMFVVVEIFGVSDLESAERVFDRDVIVGVNCRDLSTLGVDRGRFEALAGELPAALPAVAESGLGTAEEVAAVASLGYRMALVGSSLVSSPDPASKLGSLIAAGREASSGGST